MGTAASRHAPGEDSRRVLVVDDEPSILALVQLDLEDEGFEVKTAPDAATALAVARAWRPDLAVLDIRLQADDGLDLLRRLLAVHPDMPAVLLTAYPGYRDDFTAWLASAFVTKSVDTSELVRTVRELLAAGTPA